MRKSFFRKMLNIISALAILTQSFTPYFAILPSTANAQEVTPVVESAVVNTEPSAPVVTEAPVDQTVTPTPADVVVPTETVTPTPPLSGVDATPTPEVTPVDVTSTPVDNNSPPSDNNSNSNSSTSSESVTPTVTPEASVTPTSQTNPKDEQLSLIILDNISAPTIDLGAVVESGSAILTTNKPDYAPTDTALIMGSNLLPNTTYILKVWSDDKPSTGVSAQVTSDDKGILVYAYQLDGTYRPNYKAELKDQAGNVVASTSFTDGIVGTLVINEIDYDQFGTADAGEYIELKNVSSSAINLDTYELRLINGSDGGLYRTIDLPDYNLSVGDYYVVCFGATGIPTCDTAISSSPSLQNGSPDAVALYNSSNTQIDTVSYGGSVPGYTEGTGTVEDSDTELSAKGISRCPDGQDTGNNNTDFAFKDITPGTTNSCSNPAPICGNTVIETGEQCDDGNSVNGDWCNTACQVEFDTDIDGVHDNLDNCPLISNPDQVDTDNDEVGDVCDNCPINGNSSQLDDDYDGVGNVCDSINNYCGDGHIYENEQCDDGNNVSGDGCSSTCQYDTETCSPGCSTVWVGDRVCDQACNVAACNFDGGDCSILAVCGNGTVEAGEQCDDGNNMPGDGCYSCQTETTGKIVINKTTIGGDGTFDFSVSGTTSITPSIATLGGTGSTGVLDVTPGSYSVIENSQNGWTKTSAECHTATASLTPWGFNVNSGDNVTCNFTNTKYATLTIHKYTTPANDSTSFPISISGTGQINGANTGSVTTSTPVTFEVTPGNYAVTETLPAGWKLDTNGNGCADVWLSAGQNGVCNIFNSKTDVGSIKVNKKTDLNTDGDWNDSNETSNSYANGLGFSWSIDGVGTNNMGSTVSDVPVGNRSVNENNVYGYNFVGWYIPGHEDSHHHDFSCTNLEGTSLPVSVTVTKNHTKEITLCNAKAKGTLRIIKDASPNDSHDFSFSGTNGINNFTLDDDGNNSNTNKNYKVLTLNVGTYHVTENSTSGWALSGVNCVTNGQWTVNDSDLTVDVLPNEEAVCTFTNVKSGTIEAKKYEDKNGNGNKDSGENYLSNWEMKLYNGSSCSGSSLHTHTTNSSGSATFDDLVPGTYSVKETLKSGWNNSTSLCQSTTITPDDTDTLYFGNYEYASVDGYKWNDVNGNGTKDHREWVCHPWWAFWNCGWEGTDEQKLSGWTINLKDSEGVVVAADVTNSQGEYEFSHVPPGTYNVCEVQQNGWANTTPLCKTVHLSAGENECNINFGNQQASTGSVKVNKLVDRDGDGIFEDLNPSDFLWSMDNSANHVMGETASDISLGQHAIEETHVNGYHFVGWYLGHPTDNRYSCYDLPDYSTTTLSFNISVELNQTTQVNLCNQVDNGTITVIKNVVAPDGVTPVSDPNQFTVALNGGNNKPLIQGTNTVYTVNAGYYYISELPNTNYFQNGCYATGMGPNDPTSVFMVNPGDNVSVTCTNQQKNGTISGSKYNDLNGNSQPDCLSNLPGIESRISNICSEWEPKLSGWEIELKDLEGVVLATTTTNDNGDYTFGDVAPGDYRVCEVQQKGWEQTFPDFDGDNCWDVTVDSNRTSTGNDFGNHNMTPVLRITKINDATGNKSPNDTVGYTITIGNDEDAGQANDVIVTDLLPKGFVFSLGSWKVVSSDTSRGVNGDITSLLTAPVYNSPGTWTLGTLNTGETLTLTYTAKIDGGQQTGVYYDNAWGQGISESEEKVLASATADVDKGNIGDPNFVGTQVAIANQSQPIIAYTGVSKQEVLGASTYLPATGQSTIWVILATLVSGLGLGLLFLGFGLKKRYE